MKKNTMLGLGAVIIFMSLSAMLFFIFTSGSTQENSSSINLIGTWRRVSNISNGEVSLLENEYLTFTDDKMNAYKDEVTEPYMTSSYKIKNEKNLILQDISKEYVITKVTNHILCFYEDETTYTYLIRYSDEFLNENAVDYSSIVNGKWKVICHGGNAMVDEYIIFQNNLVEMYRNGEKEPSNVSTYYWDNEQMIMDEFSLDMTVYRISNDTIIFVETGTGYIWELKNDN